MNPPPRQCRVCGFWLPASRFRAQIWAYDDVCSRCVRSQRHANAQLQARRNQGEGTST